MIDWSNCMLYRCIAASVRTNASTAVKRLQRQAFWGLTFDNIPAKNRLRCLGLLSIVFFTADIIDCNKILFWLTKIKN